MLNTKLPAGKDLLSTIMLGVGSFTLSSSNISTKLNKLEAYSVNENRSYVINEYTSSISISLHFARINFILPVTNRFYFLMVNWGLNLDESGLIVLCVRNSTIQRTIIKQYNTSLMDIPSSNTTIGVYFDNLQGVVTLVCG